MVVTAVDVSLAELMLEGWAPGLEEGLVQQFIRVNFRRRGILVLLSAVLVSTIARVDRHRYISYRGG